MQTTLVLGHNNMITCFPFQAGLRHAGGRFIIYYRYSAIVLVTLAACERPVAGIMLVA